MRSTRTLLAAVVGVLLLGAGLAACGGNEEFGEGSPAPGFSLPESGGDSVGLADYGDEPVLLYFHMAEG